MNQNYGLMIKLKPEFQKELFSLLLKRYDRHKIAKRLGRTSSLIYHYKNNRTKSIHSSVLNKAIRLANISKEELIRNTTKVYNAEEERRKVFDIGIQERRDHLKRNLRSDLESKHFIKKEGKYYYIDILEWLNKTDWINKIKKQRGVLKNVKDAKVKDHDVLIQYEVFKKDTKKFEKVINIIPKKIKIDEDFMYFLGFRYGDGTNGARVGIANKEIELIRVIAIYLKSVFPNSELLGAIQIYNNQGLKLVKSLKNDISKFVDKIKIYDFRKNKNIKGDYVLCVFIVNQIFNRVYESLVNDLENFFKRLSFKLKGSFLGGFFDAEGNVNKLRKNFRLSQKIKIKVEKVGWILKNEGYNYRYDDANFIIGYKKEFWKEDLKLFNKQIFPFIKHHKKRKEAKELLEGYYVRDNYKKIVRLIKENPKINNYEISKKLKNRGYRAELTALTEAGFLKRYRKRVDESFKYLTTEKGCDWINRK